MTKCGNCKEEGHNKRTCEAEKPKPARNVVVTPFVPPPFEAYVFTTNNTAPLQITRHRSFETREFLNVAAPPFEPEPCLIRLPTIWPPLPKEPPPADVSDSGSDTSSGKYKSKLETKIEKAAEDNLNFLFSMKTKCETMEWFMLRQHFTENPHFFKTLISSHMSGGETEHHMTFEVKYEPKHHVTGKALFVKTQTYHLYGVPWYDAAAGKQKVRYTRLCNRSQADGQVYVVASGFMTKKA